MDQNSLFARKDDEERPSQKQHSFSQYLRQMNPERVLKEQKAVGFTQTQDMSQVSIGQPLFLQKQADPNSIIEY